MKQSSYFNAKLIAHIVFCIGCGSFAGYTTVLNFIRYYKNADTSIISFRRLHRSIQDDVYPDITICFEGYPLGKNVYDNFYLQKHHSLNKETYQGLLNGTKTFWKQTPNASRVADVDFDEAALKLSFKIKSVKFELIGYFVSLPDGMPNIKRNLIIRKSFQIPGMTCFTRTFGSYLDDSLVVSETFKMNLLDKQIKRHHKVMPRFFVHYPGQMLRAIFGLDRTDKTAFEINEEKLNESNSYEVKLSQMSVLKKRPDAVEPCDPTPTDDERFWKEVFRRIPCLPAYWKFFAPENTTLTECNNFTQFSELKKFTWIKPRKIQMIETEDIISSFIEPCNEMAITVTSEVEANKKLNKGYDVQVRFTYNMRKYQEIKNERDFGMESLWSYIGGYVGLFIGCSLLSILDDAFAILIWGFNVNSSLNGAVKPLSNRRDLDRQL